MYKLEGSKKEIEVWKKQRAEQGYSEYDTYELNSWFLNIIPDMLREIQKHPDTMRIRKDDLVELIKAFDGVEPYSNDEKKALELFVKHFGELVW